MTKIIHANVYDPSAPSIFKSKANDRAECQTITCINESCPLLARGECFMRGGLFGNRCPYGSAKRHKGPTKRAAKFHAWIREQKEEHKGVPFLQPAQNKMEFIGEYVLLPYSHMTMCDSVPFKSRAGFASSGDPYLPREFWTLKTVIALLNYRPMAMMGGEIVSYQREEIPKFLLHLRELDKDMWQQLITAIPQYDVEANHIGRKAVLATLNHPIEWTEVDKKYNYPVHWKWDGETLTTDSMNVFNATWGKVDIDSVVVHAKPKPLASVVVRSNDWVNERTEFLT